MAMVVECGRHASGPVWSHQWHQLSRCICGFSCRASAHDQAGYTQSACLIFPFISLELERIVVGVWSYHHAVAAYLVEWNWRKNSLHDQQVWPWLIKKKSQVTNQTKKRYGMTLAMLGIAEEMKGYGVAANSIWPRTLIERFSFFCKE